MSTAISHAGGIKANHVRCVVVTPEKTLFDETVGFVAIPLYDGELGVLPGRAPVIGRLGFGELRTRIGDLTKSYFVDGGFAQIRHDVVTVLTNRAIPVAQLDAHKVTLELQAARARVAHNEVDRADRAVAIQRAQAQLRLLERRQRN